MSLSYTKVKYKFSRLGAMLHDHHINRFDDSGGYVGSTYSPPQCSSEESMSSSPSLTVEMMSSCSFQSYLTVPLSFIVENIKNSGEANLLIQISCIASDIDVTLSRIQEQYVERHRIQTIQRPLMKSAREPLSIMNLSLIDQAALINDTNRNHLETTLETQLDTLAKYQEGLTKYMEINNSTAQELKFAAPSCESLAVQKEKIASIELVIVQRIVSIVQDHRMKMIQVQARNGQYFCWEMLKAQLEDENSIPNDSEPSSWHDQPMSQQKLSAASSRTTLKSLSPNELVNSTTIE